MLHACRDANALSDACSEQPRVQMSCGRRVVPSSPPARMLGPVLAIGVGIALQLCLASSTKVLCELATVLQAQRQGHIKLPSQPRSPDWFLQRVQGDMRRYMHTKKNKSACNRQEHSRSRRWSKNTLRTVGNSLSRSPAINKLKTGFEVLTEQPRQESHPMLQILLQIDRQCFRKLKHR